MVNEGYSLIAPEIHNSSNAITNIK